MSKKITFAKNFFMSKKDRFQIDNTAKNEIRAVLVGVSLRSQPVEKIKEYLDELEFLATTNNITTVEKFYQRLDKPDPKTFVRKGKLQEIKNFVLENNIDLVIFDDELSPSQFRNLENELKIRVIDRTYLILQIFAQRAKTAHAKLQVELAEYEYLLPRLVGMWTHLERQRGGIGLRGPGEKELETDKRRIKKQIALLKSKLEKVDRQKQIQRKSRGKLVRIALVGYTNVGKSTLMNLLTKTNVFVENKLFATLDTTTRRIELWNIPVLITDTVGFIRKLPTTLIEAFKSTLDEVREADILVHVVDISHPNYEEHVKTVEKTLREIGAVNKKEILVFNKTDLYKHIEKHPFDLTPKTKENLSINDLQDIWKIKSEKPTIFISAKNKTNIDKLKKILYAEAREIHVKRYPYHDLIYPDIPENDEN